MSEFTAEIAAGDQIAQRMNDLHDKVTTSWRPTLHLKLCHTPISGLEGGTYTD